MARTKKRPRTSASSWWLGYAHPALTAEEPRAPDPAPSPEDTGGENDGDAADDERAKAEAAFDEVDSAGNGWVAEAQFEALMEAVGTTYSVEDHKPKLLAICRSNNRLKRGAFSSWYVDWLSGKDKSSEDDEHEGDDGAAAGAERPKAGVAAFTKSQEGGWKCDACLVSNPESAVKCLNLSCETLKAGEEGKLQANAAAGATPSSTGSTGSTED